MERSIPERVVPDSTSEASPPPSPLTVLPGAVSPRELVVLAAVTLLLAWPLIQGRVLFGSDIISFLIMAQQMAANLREGILLPAWGCSATRSRRPVADGLLGAGSVGRSWCGNG